MKRFRIAALASAAIAGATVLAYAAGNWSTLPIVGMASFCGSTVTGAVLPAAQGPYGLVPGSTQGTSIGICGQTIPAGPPDLTGNELIPADTGLANGQPPATVTIPSILLGPSLPVYLALTAATSPNSYTVPAGVGTVEILAAAALSPTTIQMPAAPFDTQVLRLTSDATIATLTISPNTGQTIQTDALVTALTPSTTATYGYGFIYRASNTTWYRLY
jgi:hypothetical protein